MLSHPDLSLHAQLNNLYTSHFEINTNKSKQGEDCKGMFNVNVKAIELLVRLMISVSGETSGRPQHPAGTFIIIQSVISYLLRD